MRLPKPKLDEIKFVAERDLIIQFKIFTFASPLLAPLLLGFPISATVAGLGVLIFYGVGLPRWIVREAHPIRITSIHPTEVKRGKIVSFKVNAQNIKNRKLFAEIKLELGENFSKRELTTRKPIEFKKRELYTNIRVGSVRCPSTPGTYKIKASVSETVRGYTHSKKQKIKII